MPKTIGEIREYYGELLSNWQEMTAPSGFDIYLAAFCNGETNKYTQDELDKAVETEKEECAKVCENRLYKYWDECAKAIRARGN